MTAIRGAVSIKADAPDEIMTAANGLFDELCRSNGLVEEDFVCLIISHTKDIRTLNSAAALRKAGRCSNVPLFCVQEADIEGAMPLVIRMMALVAKPLDDVHHVYLGEAANLRPDLTR